MKPERCFVSTQNREAGSASTYVVWREFAKLLSNL